VEFGPLKLKAVRDLMVKAGRVRTNVNRHIVRLRGVFKWGVENEVIPASVHHGLMAVSGLRRGRCEVKESEGVAPVPEAYVDATLSWVSAQVSAMIQLQLLTGMRPGEVVLMRGSDLDTTGRLWVYRPQRHKTAIHGHAREVYLGPRAQELVRPFLKPDLSAHLFTPADAEAARRAALSAARKTPLSCGNRPGTNKSRKPARAPGSSYSVSAYYLAIRRGADRADAWEKGGAIIGNDERVIPRWHPHQLRHNAATRLRKEFGLEAAQVMLGHRTLTVTQLYAEKNMEAAMKIAAQVG
jgi:integrase